MILIDVMVPKKVVNYSSDGSIMETNIYEAISSIWPVFIGVISLVIILAKMHSSIQVLDDKVKVLCLTFLIIEIEEADIWLYNLFITNS
jgi:hypothetical protein